MGWSTRRCIAPRSALDCETEDGVAELEVYCCQAGRREHEIEDGVADPEVY
jgi:hypothetical protein